LDRLARLEGDAALEGLRIGMTTQGDDIGNCATAAVAASCAENIRGGAAGALARSPHTQAKALLLSMEEDPAMSVRLTVVQAAARMNTPESLALLERRTQDSDATVRGEAARLLELRENGIAK
jgi:HEAT repeat protein